jgi:hypothetical protein
MSALEAENDLELLPQLGLAVAAGGVYRTQANCFRVCREGPIAVVYPEGEWYRGCTPEATQAHEQAAR